jgi:hypothetical protein
MRPFRISSRVFLLLTLLLVLGLAACGSQGDTFEALLPADVRNAPPRVKEAYQYAVTHPDDLAAVPCYCGCGSMGHTSNLSCFVSSVAEDGTVAFDSHAAGCGICVDIAQDVMRMTAEGREPAAIRADIVATYSKFGPSNQ